MNDLVFIKKNNQVKFFFFKSKPNQTGLARFSRFFPVFARFFRFGLFFSGFFLFGFSSFFWFFAYKTEPVGFFKILIGFFLRFVFSVIFF
jgi:hypothetical protein